MSEPPTPVCNNHMLASPSSTFSTAGQCPICLEALEVDPEECDIFMPRCGHNFHQHCIREWQSSSKQDTRCPYCKKYFDPLREAVLRGTFDQVKLSLQQDGKVESNSFYVLFATQLGRLEVLKYFLEEFEANDAESYLLVLEAAAENGYFDIIQYIIEDVGFDIDVDDRLVPLNMAALNGHLDIVKYLVSKLKNLDKVDDAIQSATVQGHFDILNFLIENGANCHAHDDCAFINAAKLGRLDVVNDLISRCAELVDKKQDALFEAIHFGQLKMVQYLIEELKADIHYSKPDFKYALYPNVDLANLDLQPANQEMFSTFLVPAETELNLIAAVTSGNVNVLKYLVELGADIHANNSGAIRMAAREGNLEFIQYLLDQGSAGEQALVISAAFGNLEAVKYLIEERGCDIHYCGDAAFRLSTSQGTVETVRYLADKSADVHVHNDYAIFEAIDADAHEMVELLVDQGLADNHPEFLQKAAAFGDLRMVKCFVEKAGMDVRRANNVVLLAAVNSGHLDVVKYLVECLEKSGYHIDDNDGLVLVNAAYFGHLDIVKYAVERGADVNVGNTTALLAARRSGNIEISQFLIENGAVQDTYCSQVTSCKANYTCAESTK